MKMCIIGGGSTYTPELIEGLIRIQPDVQLDELWLLDIKESEPKFSIVAALAGRMLNKADCGITLHTTFDAPEAIEGTDFILHQFRAGGLAGRISDETVPLTYHLIGQETTGMGGMACGLRAFPILEHYVALAKRVSNQAWIINFSNPSGMLTEFMRNYLHYERVIGLCNYPINALRALQQMFACSAHDLSLKYYGLNHLSWIEQVWVNGQDRTEALWQGVQMNLQNIPDTPFEADFLTMLKLLPNPYLKYYYMTDAMLQAELAERDGPGTRGAVVQQLEDELLHVYRQPELDAKPAQLEQRGGALYSTAAAELIRDLVTDAGATHIINIRNQGAIADLPDDYVMEIPAVITRQGPERIHLGQSHAAVSGLITTIKHFERLTIAGYLQRDERRIQQAMLVHPLGPPVSQLAGLWHALKTANAAYFAL